MIGSLERPTKVSGVDARTSEGGMKTPPTKFKYLKEITKWDDDIPNHTYIFDDKNRNVGYIKTGTTEKIFYSKPSTLFSKTRRKFITLKREN